MDKAGITLSPLRRGSWKSNPAYASVAKVEPLIPFDVQIVNHYDRITTSEVPRIIWKLVGTSNGGFFIYPDSKVKRVTMRSPSGYACEVSLEVSGLIATLYALSYATLTYRGNNAAVRVSDRLKVYADGLPEAEEIFEMID
jgi:hypothetical protein